MNRDALWKLDAAPQIFPKLGSEYFRENALVVQLGLAEPVCFDNELVCRCCAGRIEFASSHFPCKPEFAIPGFNVEELFDVQETSYADLKPSFFCNFSLCSLLQGLGVIGTAAWSNPKVVSPLSLATNKKHPLILDYENAG